MPIRRYDLQLEPDSSRVLIRPFIPGEPSRITAILARALSLSEEETERELSEVLKSFSDRHSNIEAVLQVHFERVSPHLFISKPLSSSRQLFIGSLFTGEYALESAALFNPSIVPHPDQTDLPAGSIRFIMSLRATGEGHISSIEFRTGIIDAECRITVDPVSRFVTAPELLPNPSYFKIALTRKLNEMGVGGEFSDRILAHLKDVFTLEELKAAVETERLDLLHPSVDQQRTIDCIRWLAESNYQIKFDPAVNFSERIIFPVTANESNGIEDARFVRFEDDDGTVTYYATYTAYNGRVILPQLIQTQDFETFRVLSLNGKAVQNKGMALFPRKVNGKYVMISRQDDENLFIMFSDHPHYWEEPQKLATPSQPWEYAKIGNCGSPIETEAGWLLITHGVGPMRRYCIGAMLLDLDNPQKILGRLSRPLLEPEGNEREGYVPNVVYTCGALRHGRQIILPYAMSDKASKIVSFSLDDLLAALLKED
ncbi:MAG: glycosidase [Hyphomicrobiales bacterium]|nr:MAG: glycosidase [Hyphomicrobiales bacterium]